MKKVAVITDATSAGFFFPHWRDYYGGLFGLENLHLLTYAGMKEQFAGFGLGNLWEINSPYNDPLRAKVISDFVALLLRSYDVVVRADVDEFLVPDPAVAADLRFFIETNQDPYVTGRGIDVMEVAEDAPLDPALPVLGQRRYGRRLAALNKTALTSIPLRWGDGFHSTNQPPQIRPLYIFHMKFAARTSRIAWHDLMLSHVAAGTFEHGYFDINMNSLHKSLAVLPRADVASETESEAVFEARYLATVKYSHAARLHQGDFIGQSFLSEIPARFLGRV